MMGGVGMPCSLSLQMFGQVVWDVFGVIPYHVGSSLVRSDWRDVDVRVILPDAVYESFGLGNPKYPHRNKKWRWLVMAFSALGRKMTELPIDFQIQQQSLANEEYPTQLRSALYDYSSLCDERDEQ